MYVETKEKQRIPTVDMLQNCQKIFFRYFKTLLETIHRNRVEKSIFYAYIHTYVGT